MSYIQFAIKDNDQSVSYVGQLIKRTQQRIEVKTKQGVLGLPVSDIIDLKVVDEQAYSTSPGIEKDNSVVYESRTITNKPTQHREGSTRLNQALEIYQSLMTDNQHPARQSVIQSFVEQIGMTPAGASTYQQICKKHFN